MWIVIYGNPLDGFQFVGPFQDQLEAVTCGENDDGDWWVAGLSLPPDGLTSLKVIDVSELAELTGECK